MIPAFGSGEVERFRGAVARRLGLQFDDAKLAFLADVLRRRLEATSQGCEAYLARLDGVGALDELPRLAEDLTVAETYFFRHMEQYRAFSEIALPDRAGKAQAGLRPLRILSAGCASGEEPYSLAILVRESAAMRSKDVSIVGLDINPVMLGRANQARFSTWALRETLATTRQQWFRQDGRDFFLADEARESVRFEACNLADEGASFWQEGTWDIVFCRNVLMYFVPERAKSLVDRLARALLPGGYLFLGHAETLRGVSNDFHLRHTHETFYYQRRDPASFGSRPQSVAPPRAVAGPPELLVDLVDHAGTWVEAIRQASDRIEALVTSSKTPARALNPAATKPAWDIGLALELLKKERFGDALAIVDALPSESDRDVDVLLLRAVLLTHSGQLEKAEEACTRVLVADELNAGAHYLLALCREGAGDRSASMSHDQIAIYLDPAFAMPHVHLGLLARRSGDHVTARRELEQAAVLLQREDSSRLLLFGGGFGREALLALCQAELLPRGRKS